METRIRLLTLEGEWLEKEGRILREQQQHHHTATSASGGAKHPAKSYDGALASLEEAAEIGDGVVTDGEMTSSLSSPPAGKRSVWKYCTCTQDILLLSRGCANISSSPTERENASILQNIGILQFHGGRMIGGVFHTATFFLSRRNFGLWSVQHFFITLSA